MITRPEYGRNTETINIADTLNTVAQPENENILTEIAMSAAEISSKVY